MERTRCKLPFHTEDAEGSELAQQAAIVLVAVGDGLQYTLDLVLGVLDLQNGEEQAGLALQNAVFSRPCPTHTPYRQ